MNHMIDWYSLLPFPITSLTIVLSVHRLGPETSVTVFF
jgi:hypothetical protein